MVNGLYNGLENGLQSGVYDNIGIGLHNGTINNEIPINKEITKDGLVLYLDARNPSSYMPSTTKWNDLSGNKNDGTLINGPTFNSANGGSIVFDGIDDRVTLNSPSGINYGNILTAFMWVKLNNYNVVLAGHQSFNHGGYLFHPLSSNLLYTSINGGSPVSINGVGILLGVWYHLVVVRNVTSIQWYKNGVSLGTNTSSNGDNIVSSIGSYIGGGFPLNGNIASVQIYNRALSASEILQNYNATKGRFGL